MSSLSFLRLFCIPLLAPQHFSWFLFQFHLFQLYFFMVSLVLCVLYWRSSYWSSRCFEFTRALFSLCSTFIFSLCVLPQFLSSCHLVCFLLPLSFELYQHAKNGLLCFQIIHVKDIPLNLEISTKCFCGHRIQIRVHAVSSARLKPHRFVQKKNPISETSPFMPFMQVAASKMWQSGSWFCTVWSTSRANWLNMLRHDMDYVLWLTKEILL